MGKPWVFIPTRRQSHQAELEALKKAAMELDKILISNGVNVDDLVTEFRSLREKDRYGH